jgi:hypothetical protein
MELEESKVLNKPRQSTMHMAYSNEADSIAVMMTTSIET